jgi:hypothetical protein
MPGNEFSFFPLGPAADGAAQLDPASIGID